MNRCYRQPVLLFGAVAPLVTVVSLLGVVSWHHLNIEDSSRARQEQYKEDQKAHQERAALQRQVDELDPQLKCWTALLETPPSPAAKALLDDLKSRYPVVFSSFLTRPHGGIGTASKQPSARLQLCFRGTYRDLQNTFLELETCLPQLQLDSIKLRPAPDHRLLEVDIAYTAWKNG